MWPLDADSLEDAQRSLATASPEPWVPATRPARVGGCWVCFPRGISGPGATGDPAWAAAVVTEGGRLVDRQVLVGEASGPYLPGLMALRVGPLLERTVRALDLRPDVLLLDATGRDHPRGAGLAVHLGAELDLPTAGVTHRPLHAEGDWPGEQRGDRSALLLEGRVVAGWLRTQPKLRPLVVHPGWRVGLELAVDLILAETVRHRTPQPLRLARRLAREARAADHRP